MTGRRYEDSTPSKRSGELRTLPENRSARRAGSAQAPDAAGIENHKGWRSAEQAAWTETVGSEWVGVHFDFGNNVALCEDPMET